MKIKNIRVLDRVRLCLDLKFNSPGLTSKDALSIVDLLVKNPSCFESDRPEVFSAFYNSAYIRFEDDTDSDLMRELVGYDSVFVDNKIVNKNGLKPHEEWFNNLSDEQKEYVRQLAGNNFASVVVG